MDDQQFYLLSSVYRKLSKFDKSLYQLGVKLGIEKKSENEIAESLHKLFLEYDFGNLLSDCLQELRTCMEDNLTYDEDGYSEIDSRD